MAIMRGPIAEGALQQDLPRRAEQQVSAPHDFGDAVSLVIDDDGEVVGERAVAPLNDEIPGLTPAVLADRALESVLEFDRRLVRVDAKPLRLRSVARRSAVATGPRINGLRGRIGGPCGCDYGAAAAARITKSRGLQDCKRLPVGIDLVGLEVDASIPLEPEYLQRGQKLRGQAGIASLAIEIVDAQEPAAAAAADAQVAAGGGQQRPKM